MLKSGAWEVPVAGSRSETVWNGFFFRRVYGAIYVVKGKMTRRTLIHRLTEGHTRVEAEFGTVFNICICLAGVLPLELDFEIGYGASIII